MHAIFFPTVLLAAEINTYSKRKVHRNCAQVQSGCFPFDTAPSIAMTEFTENNLYFNLIMKNQDHDHGKYKQTQTQQYGFNIQ